MKIREIYRAFEGKLVGNYQMKMEVCRVLAVMPYKITRFVTKNCWFVSSMEDAWAYTLTGNDLTNQHLIFLSEELFGQSVEQIKHTIAHEIGHVVLGHRNSTFVKQTREEISKQEKEADEFAAEFGF